MLDGLTCQECGEFFGDMMEDGATPPGFPRTCNGCSGVDPDPDGDDSLIAALAPPPRLTKRQRRLRKATLAALRAPAQPNEGDWDV